MEKQKQPQRHRGKEKGSGKGPESLQRTPVLPESVPTTDLGMAQLSGLADSARQEIIRAKSGQDESGTAAQADLLISRNKIEEVRRKIQTGYYGQPDIIGQIIDRLSDDLRP
ncbi:MAG: hypothetical protein WAU88_13510 [Candidatus Zixiibacteriota bacterium]|jgi:hypothetical protein